VRVLITGGSSGIGLHTARGIARQGHDVVLLVRSAERGAQAADRIESKAGSRPEVVVADLAEQAQIRRVVPEIGTIDVLINNAGLLLTKQRMTPDGFEETFAVNHLAPFLLTTLLLERGAIGARVVTVASIAHTGAWMNLEDPMYEWEKFSGWNAYCQSKLANILFAFELARRLQGTSITSNALHPGFVRSGFARNNGILATAAMLAATPFTISEKRGAKTSIHVATSPDVEGVSGRYFAASREARASAQAGDPDLARGLWELSERLVSASRPASAVPPGRST